MGPEMLKALLQLEGKEFNRVAAGLFAYLFYRFDQKKFIAYVGDKKVSDHILDILSASLSDDSEDRGAGYILKNCKLYAWAYHHHRLGGDRPNREHYEVEKEDAAFLRRLNLSHLSTKFESFDLVTYDSMFEELLTSSALKTHIGKLVSKKMKFIYDSYGVDRKDLEGELRSKAIQALYMQYPRFHSALHFTNVAKTTIHNKAMSMISYYTSPARQRLYLDAEGRHQAVVETLDVSAHKIESGPSYMSHIKEHLETIANLGPKMKPEVQRFIMVAAGHFDEEFSRFLKDDNSVVVDEMSYTRYLEKARKFFGFPEKRVDNIFARLRNHLAA